MRNKYLTRLIFNRLSRYFLELLLEKCNQHHRYQNTKQQNKRDDASVSPSVVDYDSASDEEVKVAAFSSGVPATALIRVQSNCKHPNCPVHGLVTAQKPNARTDTNMTPVAPMLPSRDEAPAEEGSIKDKSGQNDASVDQPPTTSIRAYFAVPLTADRAHKTIQLHSTLSEPPRALPSGSTATVGDVERSQHGQAKKRTRSYDVEVESINHSTVKQQKVYDPRPVSTKLVVVKLTPEKLMTITPAQNAAPATSRPANLHSHATPPPSTASYEPHSFAGLDSSGRLQSLIDEAKFTKLSQKFGGSKDDDIMIRKTSALPSMTDTAHQSIDVEHKSSGVDAGKASPQKNVDLLKSMTLSFGSGLPVDEGTSKSFSANLTMQRVDAGVDLESTGRHLDTIELASMTDTLSSKGALPPADFPSTRTSTAAARAPEPGDALAAAANRASPDNTTTEKKLVIQLNLPGDNLLQFVIVDLDSSVESLFVQIQARMDRRVDRQTIECLHLWLHSYGDQEDENEYLVERNDPDTWKIFLDGARKIGHAEVRVDADVKV